MLPRLERYEIDAEIGHGGMATVYRARDTRLDRWVAVKVMHPHLRGTEQARARFSREARAVAKLKHRSILEIYDYSGNDSENAYIATELLTGPTLRAFFEARGEVPAEIAACIGVALAEALAAAHAQGIVHRDVKPENVLLHENKSVKLTDFGIADMLDPSMSAMTATGQILGSPAHMAPEQVEGGDADARSDVFALGTILYWLATGSLPFSGKNPHQVLKRVVDCNPTDPLLLKPSMGRALRDIILRCLAKDPAQRYQRAEDLAHDLAGMLRDLGVDDSHAELEAYLKDPEGEGPKLRAVVLAKLLSRARAAVAARNRPLAIDQLDRVLALEDGHPEALGLLADLDNAARKRAVARGGFACVGLAALVALWFAFAPKSGATSAPLRPTPKVTGVASAPATKAQSAVPDTALPAPPATPTTTPTSRKKTPSASDERRSVRPPPPQKPRETGPRTVVFAPEPANVSVSVDGEPQKPFGPSFRMVELAAGHHTFRFVGAHECCEDRVIELDVPPGPGETVVSARLAFRPARLYVVSDVPADVAVDDGLAIGRTRSLINVPVERTLIERRRISVTAPGHEPYTGSVQLRAGEVSQLQVALKPSAPR